MLRAASPDAIRRLDPLGLSTFPLVPYSNRVANTAFDWEGHKISLAPNFYPELHPIHGVGWQRQWAIERADDTSATIMIVHVPDKDWPWAFEARQSFILAPHALTIKLSVRNCANQRVPLAFGHHPYFEAAGASLQFDAEQVWMIGDDGLPSAPVAPAGQFDFATIGAVQGRNIDHCYAGVSGCTRIEWTGRPFGLELSSSPQMEAAVIYIPIGGDAFCFEPVPHINNALHLPGHAPTMPVVDVGGVFETTIEMKAVPR
jgi:aldose 1-epimerase